MTNESPQAKTTVMLSEGEPSLPGGPGSKHLAFSFSGENRATELRMTFKKIIFAHSASRR